ncbi:MAG TPA: CysB family HTH-type transcriptional regulator [Burkholderiales bacterium]|nr:CysB family HTH-type transcriptional regulator [Burkholderiales bacterium]
MSLATPPVNLRQLRYVLEVHRRGNHISAAAEAMHTSQPGMSKQIQLLEQELGFEVFQRKRNRVVGLTDPGREVIEIAQRILNDVENLRTIRDDYHATAQGSLTIATTHTYARYVLPRVVEKFVQRYPDVRLGLQQGNPTQICEAVEKGEADLALGTETMRPFPSLVMLPCFPIARSIIAKKGHPILRVKNLTLEELAKYPIIAHDRARSGRWKVMDAFHKHGIEPNIIFGAVDADVCKTYVELGLGVAILATVAVDPKHDRDLRARDASQLFESSTTYISLRAHSYLRRYVFDFIRTFAPSLTPDVVRAAIQNGHKSPLNGVQRESRNSRAPLGE